MFSDVGSVVNIVDFDCEIVDVGCIEVVEILEEVLLTAWEVDNEVVPVVVVLVLVVVVGGL